MKRRKKLKKKNLDQKNESENDPGKKIEGHAMDPVTGIDDADQKAEKNQEVKGGVVAIEATEAIEIKNEEGNVVVTRVILVVVVVAVEVEVLANPTVAVEVEIVVETEGVAVIAVKIVRMRDHQNVQRLKIIKAKQINHFNQTKLLIFVQRTIRVKVQRTRKELSLVMASYPPKKATMMIWICLKKSPQVKKIYQIIDGR